MRFRAVGRAGAAGAAGPGAPERPRVLVVGQVPPPFHGQAIMVETLLRGSYPSVELIHVDASYSTSLEQIGAASFDKVRRMLSVVLRSLRHRVRSSAQILYYHPAGANRSAVLRDIVVLGLLRPAFRHTVFHHHARGLLPAIDALPRPLGFLARRAFRTPDLAIAPSQALLDEVRAIHPRRAVVVPNGTVGGTPVARRPSRMPRILFLNLVSRPKGAHWLLQAVADLHHRGLPVEAVFAGDFPSADERAAFVEEVDSLGLAEHVRLPGLVVGDDKWELLASADVFCVPTTYEQESFGLALVEAASCGLPIVATDVPGLREVFRHDETALLADPDEPTTLTDHLHALCTDEQRRTELGRAGRALFEERYTEAAFWDAMEALFADLAADVAATTGGRSRAR